MGRHHVIYGIAGASFVVALLLLLGGLWLSALGLAALGILVLLIGRKVAQPSWAYDGPAAAPRPVPQEALLETDLDGIPEPVVACPHCGYLGIRAPTLHDGGMPGVSELLDKRICRRCGYQGLPVEFSTREDYRAFLRDLATS